MTTELTAESLTRLVELIRTRRASPVEIAAAYLQQIDKLNPSLNAVVTIAPDVMDQARAAEAAVMRGANFGALHAVPITLKDTLETARLRPTIASAIPATFIPDPA